MARYLDVDSIVRDHSAPLAEAFAAACGVQYDVVGLPFPSLRPGDVAIVGPWLDRSWLPTWVSMEPSVAADVLPVSRTEDILACALRDRGLPIGLRLKPPGPRSKHYAAFLEAQEWVTAVQAQLPRDVHIEVGAGHGFAPFTVVTDANQASEVLASLHGRPFGFDFETDSLDPRKVTRLGLALADANHAWWIPDCTEVLEPLVVLLRDPKSEPRGSNVKYDLKVLARKYPGFEPTQTLPKDTQVQHWVWQPNELRHGLKVITRKYLGDDVLEFGDVGGPEHFWDMPHQVQGQYAAAGDARHSYDLVDFFDQKLAEDKLTEVYERFERPVTPVIAEMELMGMHLDRKVMFDIATDFDQWMVEVRRELKELGFTGNPNADQNIADYLYKQCQMPVLQRTAKTERGSVSMDVLRRLRLLADTVESVAAHLRELELFMEWSESEKAFNTFIVPPLSDWQMRVLYAEIMQTRTITGRFASRPNIQNWPAHGRRARLREMVVPPEGMIMGLADYAQIEPRFGAHYSQDPKLLEDFRNRKDVYASLGRDMGFPEHELTKHADRRQNMKIVYLAWQYLTSPQQVQVIALRGGKFLPLQECIMYHEGITAARPAYVKWREQLFVKAAADREIRDEFGRRRFTWQMHSVDPAAREAAKREVSNFPNQAGAAGMIKGATPAVQALCKQAGGSLWNQVHDELDWYVNPMSDKQKQEFEAEVTKAMLWYELSVPLEVEFGWSEKHWAECK